MRIRLSLPPERDPKTGGLLTFRQQVLGLVAVIVFYGIWLLKPWVVSSSSLNVHGTYVIIVGIALALVVGMERTRRPAACSWLLALGGLVLAVLIYAEFGHDVTLVLLPVSVLLGSALLGLWPGVGLGVLVVGILLIFSETRTGLENAWLWVTLTGASCALGVLVHRAIRVGDYWEEQFTIRQRELIGQLRERQGELNASLKALDEAYTQLQRSNRELVVARQAAEEARVMKEQFVANVSHELRTPLNLIVGFAEIMYLSPESYENVGWTPDLESDIRQIYRASRHLQSLIDDILDLSRIDAARLPMFRETADLRDVVLDAMETIHPLLEQHHLDSRVECPDSLPPLFIDRTRIRQVMLNLLNNAVRFTDTGGITVRLEQTAEAVLVSVQDTGIGMPQEQLAIIFQEFRQGQPGRRSRGGAGLGLAISRRFVELHGGRMWAESQVGVGSTFTFSLPLPGAVPQTVPLVHTATTRSRELLNAPVIVVDPDPGLTDMLQRYLGDRHLLPAQDLAQAETLIETEHPAAIVVNQPPDAPPDAWVGTLGEASRRYHVPVLRCSIPSASWLLHSHGISDCLIKPVSRDTLKQVLERHCPSPPTTRALRVLLIDDDSGFVSLISRMLYSLDPHIETITAYTGSQALRLAAEQPPDLVLLDLLMPEMDGFQVLEGLRKLPGLEEVPMVLVTATSYAEEALRRLGSCFTLTRHGGIGTGKLTELIRLTLELSQPDYVSRERELSNA